MIRNFRAALMVIALALCVADATRAQSVNGVDWPDHIAGDYDVLPNITYSVANNSALKLDLYLPRHRRSPVPTVVLIHGGGWVEGDKESAVLHILPYLSMGWAVVNVEYRLGRNSLAPAAVEDCRCALRWVTRHAREHNLDASKIVLTGFSAGGHLALITALLPSSSIFDRQCPTDEIIRWREATEPPLKVAAVVNWFGITDVADLLGGTNAKHYAIEWFGSISNREDLARQVSPINHIRAGLPPVITIHGNADTVVPFSHATRLHAALDNAGVRNQLVTVRGGKHGGFGRQDVLSSYAAIRKFLERSGLSKVE